MIKRKEFMLGAVAGLTVAAAATAGGVIDWPTAEAQVSGVSGRIVPSAGMSGAAFAPPQGAPRSFADIFQQVAPAVVQINVESRIVGDADGTIQIPGTPFRIPVPQPEEGEEAPTNSGAGSGFFISADGYIVTNNHVVEDATEINVVLTDGREFEARVVGRDPATDLAVLKIDGSDYPFVQFEEEAQPRVGDWVLAVGNPFQLGGTATAGIVSGLARQNIDPRQTGAYVDFLQIDAAINTGNSGGPTFDIYGRVIGVNTAIYSSTGGGSVGIGFAIPASIAKSVTDQLVAGGRVDRGYVGLGLNSFDGDRWEALGQPRDFEGAFVDSVTPDGPAARAGVQVGDLLVGVNGEEVEDGTEATRLVGAARPGDSIRLDILRDGRRRTINVRSGTRPPEDELNASLDGSSSSEIAPDAAPEGQGQAVEGLSVAAITPALRRRFQIPESVTGVVIASIERGSVASRSRFLQPGVVITRVGAQPIASAADLRVAVMEARRAGRPSVLLFLNAGNQRGTEVLRLSDD